jgi:BRCA1-associated protein
VHLLIENVDDGKFVEISDPHSGAMEQSLIPELADMKEGEVVHRKLKGYASDYYTLLKSQLK